GYDYGSASCLSSVDYLQVDDSDGLVSAGLFSGTCDFGTGVLPPKAGPLNRYFIARSDCTGQVSWVRDIQAHDLTGFALGPCCVTALIASLKGNVDLGNGLVLTSQEAMCMACGGDEDVYVLVLDSSGNTAWARRLAISASVADVADSVAFDSQGNVFVTGGF